MLIESIYVGGKLLVLNSFLLPLKSVLIKAEVSRGGQKKLFIQRHDEPELPQVKQRWAQKPTKAVATCLGD